MTQAMVSLLVFEFAFIIGIIQLFFCVEKAYMSDCQTVAVRNVTLPKM